MSVPEVALFGDGLEDSVTPDPGESWFETSHEDNVAALFLQLGIGIGRDPRLARSAAVAVYVNVRGHAPGFPLYFSTICRQTGWGRDAVKRAMSILEKYGYLKRKQARTRDGEFGRMIYHTNDAPAGSPQSLLMAKLAAKLVAQAAANPDALDDAQAALLGRLVASGFAATPGIALTSNFVSTSPETGNPSPALTSNFATGGNISPETGNPSPGATSNSGQSSSSAPVTGFPATENPSPLVERESQGEQETPQQNHTPKTQPPAVPDARRAVTQVRPESFGGYAAPKLTPATRKTIRQELRAVLTALLPPGFVSQLPTNMPNVMTDTYAAASAERDPAQIRQRIERRWSLMFDNDHHAGTLHRPVPITVHLLGRTLCRVRDCDRYCPDARCEDGVIIDSDKMCVRCQEHAAEHVASALPAPAPAAPQTPPQPAAEPRPAPAPPTVPAPRSGKPEAAPAAAPVGPPPSWWVAAGDEPPAAPAAESRSAIRAILDSRSAAPKGGDPAPDAAGPPEPPATPADSQSAAAGHLAANRAP